jgi:hypothetical protein
VSAAKPGRPDLTRCWSCKRTAIAHGKAIGVLAVLTSPRGPYALCPACAGSDLQRREPQDDLERIDQEIRRAAAADVLAWYASDGTLRKPGTGPDVDRRAPATRGHEGAR